MIRVKFAFLFTLMSTPLSPSVTHPSIPPSRTSSCDGSSIIQHIVLDIFIGRLDESNLY